MDNEILNKIEKNTRSKRGFDVVLSGNSTRLRYRFNPSLQLNGNWGIALRNISTYNTIPNITSNNNKFKYFQQ